MATAINRVYEDVEPTAEWAREEAYDTLIVYLPGFRKEHLKIQVTSSNKIRVLGERSVGHDNKWQHFRKEFPIPTNCDTNDISAKFESGILYVKLPKTIAPLVEEAPKRPPPTEAQKPPTTEAQKPPTTETKKPQTTEAQKPLPTEAQKPQTTEAQKPLPKEAHKPTTEAPKPQKPMSGSDHQQVPSLGPMDHKQKQTNGSTADGHAKQTPEKEKAAESSNAAAQKALEKEKRATNDHELAKANTKSTEDHGEKKVADSIKGAIHDGQEDGVDKSYYRPPQGYSYRPVVDGFVRDQLKQPRRLVNLVLTFLFFLVLGLYVKYAINSIEEFKRQEL